LHRRLHRIALETLSDFVLPDGVDGYVHVEYAILRPEGVCLLDVLEGSGRLIAGERLAEWTLMGKRRFPFPNPLRPLNRKVTAVRLAMGRVPVSGLVVLGDGLEVPRAQPESVVSLDGLVSRFPPLRGDAAVPPAYAEAWARLADAPSRAPG